jgi:hypothetical protein
MDIDGSSADQAIRVGLGEIPELRIGDLIVRHLATASVPIPALDGFGNRRPELIVGYTIFLGASVRVDYAKSEIVLTRPGRAVAAANATGIPFRVLDGKFVADVTLDGTHAPLELDTGNSGGISLVKTWGDAHGFPGTRAAVEMRTHVGAGNDESTLVMFRLADATLGPIRHADRLADISAPPARGLAGLVGNELFSRCAAISFDVAKRTMRLEPPCDRPSPESLSGWRLTRKDDARQKDRPWVIEAVVPAGSAARAGLEVGDRVLSVENVAADLDVAKIQTLVERPAGTKLRVVYERAGARRDVTMELVRLLAK